MGFAKGAMAFRDGKGMGASCRMVNSCELASWIQRLLGPEEKSEIFQTN